VYCLCKSVLYYCHRVSTQLKLTSIAISISVTHSYAMSTAFLKVSFIILFVWQTHKLITFQWNCCIRKKIDRNCIILRLLSASNPAFGEICEIIFKIFTKLPKLFVFHLSTIHVLYLTLWKGHIFVCTATCCVFMILIISKTVLRPASV
jgi:hypothetical protein